MRRFSELLGHEDGASTNTTHQVPSLPTTPRGRKRALHKLAFPVRQPLAKRRLTPGQSPLRRFLQQEQSCDTPSVAVSPPAMYLMISTSAACLLIISGILTLQVVVKAKGKGRAHRLTQLLRRLGRSVGIRKHDATARQAMATRKSVDHILNILGRGIVKELKGMCTIKKLRLSSPEALYT